MKVQKGIEFMQNKYDIINTIYTLWQEHCPYIRFMQLLDNFSSWEKTTNNIDVYYLPDEKVIEHFTRYIYTIY